MSYPYSSPENFKHRNHEADEAGMLHLIVAWEDNIADPSKSEDHVFDYSSVIPPSLLTCKQKGKRSAYDSNNRRSGR